MRLRREIELFQDKLHFLKSDLAFNLYFVKERSSIVISIFFVFIRINL